MQVDTGTCVKAGDLIQINEGYEYLKSYPSGPLLIIEEYSDNSRVFPEPMFKMLFEERTWTIEADLVEKFYDIISSGSL